MRGGRDMGGLFFVPENPAGWRYALGYTMRYADGAIYRCKVDIEREDVFDIKDGFARRLMQQLLPEETFSNLMRLTGHGHLPWMRNPDWQRLLETLLTKAGYLAAVVQERTPTAPGGAVVSLCVFDPARVKIVGVVPKAEAMERFGRTKLGATLDAA